LAAAQAQSARATTPVRFPGEDGGQSLGEMAQRDLDAALQLLADRAQYITGASGAAIALRRDGMADMLCRASTGTNAPELGALLSTEFGLSGESVRTKRALRCDDAERDARVNREVCRQLGIASVVVMPVVNDDQVLGVFELFSGKANAFGERDLSAIQRLSEMVETAIRLAQASTSLPKKLGQEGSSASTAGPGVREGQFVSDLVIDAASVGEALPTKPAVAPETRQPVAEAKAAQQHVEPAPNPTTSPIVAPKKPLFWSATAGSESEVATPVDEVDQSHVPPMLRQLRKCEACGFPVSAGRTLCVECEEKKWRGQLRPQAARSTAGTVQAIPSSKFGAQASAAAAPGMAKAPSTSSEIAALSGSDHTQSAQVQAETAKIPKKEVAAEIKPAATVATASEQIPAAIQNSVAEFVLSAGVTPSQSWVSANKYVILVLLVIAAAAAAVFYLR